MEIDQRKAREYSDKILKQFQKDPSKMGPHERKLAEKYYVAKNASDRIDQEVRQINQQIAQGQARVRSLELQYTEQAGKAAAFMEYIIALKFDVEKPSNENGDDKVSARNKAPATRRKKTTKAKQGAGT